MTTEEIIGILLSAFAIGYAMSAILKYFKQAVEKV